MIKPDAFEAEESELRVHVGQYQGEECVKEVLVLKDAEVAPFDRLDLGFVHNDAFYFLWALSFGILQQRLRRNFAFGFRSFLG